MLITPGDLIPVQPEATIIPWTRRKSQILNFLHRGPVTFKTLVYDTNVGDISSLATYFNPERVSVKDLNSRFGQHPSSGDNSKEEDVKVGSENVIKPRLLLYPEHNLNHSQVQRTLKWVLSHQDGEDNADPPRLPPIDNIGSVRLGPADHIPSSRHASADNMVPTRFGSIDNLSSTRTGSTDNLSRSGSMDVRWKRSSGPVTGIRIGENLNINQGPRPVSRPASVSRLTPIGHPLNPEQTPSSDTSSVLGIQELRTLPSTMPNLSSALNSVWSELPRDMSISHESIDRWPSYESKEVSW